MDTPRIAPVEPPFDSEVMPRSSPAGCRGMRRSSRWPSFEPSRGTCRWRKPCCRSASICSAAHATLGIREREIVIQRVCARLGCEYEWGVHATFFGAPAGIDDKTMKATVLGRPDDKVWKGTDALLVRLVDELHYGACVSDALWAELGGALHAAAAARDPRARRLVPRDRLRRERRGRAARELGGALPAAVDRRSAWTWRDGAVYHLDRSTRGDFTMRFGLTIGYSGTKMALDMPLIQEADRLGFHSVWSAEAYGSDAVTPLAWIAARTERIHVASGIMQMPARTPAMTAMTATTLDQLSGGRFLLGLGVSGPQVVEGWHGEPYGKPLVQHPRVHRDRAQDLGARAAGRAPGRALPDPVPRPGRDAGSASRSRASSTAGRSRSTSPRSARRASSRRPRSPTAGCRSGTRRYRTHVFKDALDAGFARAGGGKSLADFDIAAAVNVVVGDDVQKCLGHVKPGLALYIGGMGARGKNFYNDLACRYGFEDAAKKIQDLYLAGKKDEAAAAVPDRARRRGGAGRSARAHPRPAAAWRESGVTTVVCGTRQIEADSASSPRRRREPRRAMSAAGVRARPAGPTRRGRRSRRSTRAREIAIAAPAAEVFAWLVHAERWPEWYSQCTQRRASSPGPRPALGIGSRFRWTVLGVPVVTDGRRVRRAARLAWSGTGLGAAAYHSWDIEPTPTAAGS